MKNYRIICGDSVEIYDNMKIPHAKCIFADPPDNINLQYDKYIDKTDNYKDKAKKWVQTFSSADIIWWSVGYQHEAMYNVILDQIKNRAGYGGNPANFKKAEFRKIIWNFDFGQYRTKDFANDFRPIIRTITKKDAKTYPQNILVPSARQTKYNDKRAVSGGRVPSDVWKFPRVAGTHTECRKWHPTQHPEALLERIIKFSTKPGDLVIDPFGGSGTTLRVCQKLKRKCIIMEYSEAYCEKMGCETGVTVEYYKSQQQ